MNDFNLTTRSVAQGLACFRKGELERAERHYKKALQTIERDAGDDNPELADVFESLAQICIMHAEFTRAEEYFEKSFKVLRRAQTIDHPRFALSLRALADLASLRADTKKANHLYERALGLWKDILKTKERSISADSSDMDAIYRSQQVDVSPKSMLDRSKQHGFPTELGGMPFPARAMFELAHLYLKQQRAATSRTLSGFAMDELQSAQRAAKRSGTESELDFAIVLVLKQQAEIALQLDSSDRAEPLLQRALELLTLNESSNHPDAGDLLLGLAQAAFSRGELDAAARFNNEALLAIEGSIGTQNPRYAKVLRELGAIARKKHELEASELKYRHALDIMQASLGYSHPDLAVVLDELGQVLVESERIEEAETLYFRAINITGAAAGAQPLVVAYYYDRLAKLYESRGKFSRAESAHQKALEIRREALVVCHDEIATTMVRLGALYSKWGKYAEAEGCYKNGVEITAKLLGKESHEYSEALDGLAQLYKGMARFREAEESFKQLIELEETRGNYESPEVVQAMCSLAELYVESGRIRDAKKQFQLAADVIFDLYGESHKSLARTQIGLAGIAFKDEDLEGAEKLCREALELVAHNVDADSVRFRVKALLGLARIQAVRCDFDAAARLVRDSIVAADEGLGTGSKEAVNAILFMSALQQQLGKANEGFACLKQAIAIVDKHFGGMHPVAGSVYFHLARHYVLSNQNERANEFYMRALSILDATLGNNHPELGALLIDYSTSLIEQGDIQQSETILARGISVQERALGSKDPSVIAGLVTQAELYRARNDQKRASQTLYRCYLLWQEAQAAKVQLPLKTIRRLAEALSSSPDVKVLPMVTYELGAANQSRRMRGDYAALCVLYADLEQANPSTDRQRLVQVVDGAINVINAQPIMDQKLLQRAQAVRSSVSQSRH